MHLVQEADEVPQVGVCVVLSANDLGGEFYSYRPCLGNVQGTVDAVLCNLIPDEVLEGLHVRHGRFTRPRFPIALGSRGSIFMLAEKDSLEFRPPK